MRFPRKILCYVFLLIISLFVGACGGGGSSSGSPAPGDDKVIEPASASQAVLGPLAGAEIRAYRLSDLSNPAEGPVAADASLDNLEKAGTFNLKLSGVSDAEWVLVTATGGSDVDADDNGVLDARPTPNAGTIHALATAAEWRAGAKVNVLSEIGWQQVKARVESGVVDDLAERLRWVAGSLLAEDLNGDGVQDHKDLVHFVPYSESHKAKLSIRYQQFFEPASDGVSFIEGFHKDRSTTIASHMERLFGDSLELPEASHLIPVSYTVEIPENLKGVTSQDAVVRSFVSDSAEIQDSPVPNLLMAEDAEGRTLLLGYAMPKGAVEAMTARAGYVSAKAVVTMASAQNVELSPRSTALALVMMAIGGGVSAEERAILSTMVVNHPDFYDLETQLTGGLSANPFFLDSLMNYPEVVSAIKELGQKVLDDYIADITSAQQPTATLASVSVLPMALAIDPVREEDFWRLSDWNDDEPWEWYGEADSYNVLLPPFLAASDSDLNPNLYALANPTMVNYAAEYFDAEGNWLDWRLANRNSTMIQKIKNSGAAQRTLQGPEDIWPEVAHVEFNKYWLRGGTDEGPWVRMRVLHGMNLFTNVADLLVNIKAVKNLVNRYADKINDLELIEATLSCSNEMASTVDFGGSDGILDFIFDNKASIFETAVNGCIVPFGHILIQDKIDKLGQEAAGAALEIAAKLTNPSSFAWILFNATNQTVPFGISLFGAESRIGYDLEWQNGKLAGVSREDARPAGSQKRVVLPQADFTAEQGAGKTVKLTSASVVDPDVTFSYTWEFDDGTNDSGESVTHSFVTTGKKYIRLRVEDGLGNSHTMEKAITVTDGRIPVIKSVTATVNETNPRQIRLSAVVEDPDNDLATYFWYKDAWADKLDGAPDETIDAEYRFVDFVYDQEFIYSPALVVVDAAGNQSKPYFLTVATGGSGYVADVSPRIAAYTGGDKIHLYGQHLDKLNPVMVKAGDSSIPVSLNVDATGTHATLVLPEFNEVGIADLVYYVDVMVDANTMRSRRAEFKEAIRLVAGGNLPDVTGGLVAYYPFDGNAEDFTGNGNHGQIHGGLTFEGGAVGQAARFNGQDSFLYVPGHPSMNLSEWTITFWMKPVSTPANYVQIFSKEDDSGGNYNYAVVYRSNSTISGQYEKVGNEFDHTLYATVPVGQWAHVAITRDATSGMHGVYVDGSLVASGIWNDNPEKNSEPLIMGHLFDSQISYFHGDTVYDGYLDDLRLYNRALSAAEIATLISN